MLKDEDKKQIQNRFKDITHYVKLIFFTQKLAGACQYCTETEQLLKEVSTLSEKIELQVYNFVTDKAQVESYGIDKIPATVIEGKQDYGIRFYGIPAGYEFATFLDVILMVSSGSSGINSDFLKKIQKIQKPVHIQVFVTPNCPYCTRAAFIAQQLTVESAMIKASIVEVTEFPQLGQKYGVMGVPKIVINEEHRFEGALPENLFVEHVLNAVKD